MNHRIIYTTSLILLFWGMSIAASQKGTMTDSRDGKTYKTVKIGSQTWMAENLNYETEESERLRYGHLYTWEDAQSICPDGWHLPNYDEWNQLLKYSSKKSSNDERWINLLSKDELLVHYCIVTAGICNDAEMGSIDKIKKNFGVKGNKDLDRRICQYDNMYCSTYSQKRGRDLYGFNARIVGSGRAMGEDCDVYDYVAFWTSPDKNDHFFVSNVVDAVCPDCDESEIKENKKFYVRCLQDEKEYVSRGSMTDSRDGKTYEIVEIGRQTWMAENLNYETENSFCYDDESANCEKYGRLYTWDAAMEACPSGWHLPNNKDWSTLKKYAESEMGKGKAGMALRGNYLGFNAQYGGDRFQLKFQLLDESGYYWSATEDDESRAYDWVLFANSDDLINGSLKFSLKKNGFSVRCLQD